MPDISLHPKQWRMLADPWNQTLVESRNTTSSPDVPECLTHWLRTVRSHLSLENLEGLSDGSDLEHVHRGTYSSASTLHIRVDTTRRIITPTSLVSWGDH